MNLKRAIKAIIIIKSIDIFTEWLNKDPLLKDATDLNRKPVTNDKDSTTQEVHKEVEKPVDNTYDPENGYILHDEDHVMHDKPLIRIYDPESKKYVVWADPKETMFDTVKEDAYVFHDLDYARMVIKSIIVANPELNLELRLEII